MEIVKARNPGCGKTHLSIGIAKRAIESGTVAAYNTVPSICQELERRRFSKKNRDYDDNGDSSTDEYEDTLRTVDLLILDDLGAEAATQYSVSQMYEIINARINARKATVISTNLTNDEIERVYGTRVLSRLKLFTPLNFAKIDMRDYGRATL
ncbi:hypothetical protein AGMMS49975_05970 [Clostridia bacterium]|nr:hypothetical protein AGMMS49975_05970 [Clostridia bacterium]